MNRPLRGWKTAFAVAALSSCVWGQPPAQESAPVGEPASAHRSADEDNWLALVSSASAPAQPPGQLSESATLPAAKPETEKPPEISLPGGSALLWDGPVLRVNDGWLKVRAGGKVMYDLGWIDGHGLGEKIGENLEDTGQWRRLRPNVQVSLFNTVLMKAEAEFVGSEVTIKDMFVRVQRLPAMGDFTVGYFKEPFGLEELVSSADTTFLERALPNAFSPGRNFGVMFNNSVFDQRATWALGAFKNTEACCTGSTSQGNACALTGRATFLPYYANDGADLVHLGGAMSFRRPENAIEFSQRPEAHFVPKFTNTKSIDADHEYLLGAELAWVRGPFSVQSQYSAAMIDTADSGFLYLDGFYVQASYFLTGETRPYDRHTGVFTGVKPHKDFLAPGGGLGAWEVAARYSLLDLDRGDLPSSARDMQDMTLGLNWYLSPALRVSWNYIRSWVEGDTTSGAADIFMMRLQVAF